jgi:cephalosporin-C deacetylase-like acetyl esterase
MIDQDAIVAAGNSCGGIVALGLAAADERMDAVFVLSWVKSKDLELLTP